MAPIVMGKSVALFLLAAVCEIGGGYLVWQWLRGGRTAWLAAAGAAVLFGYGIVHTFQPAHFGRVYAAYGILFVPVALLWGWWMDGHRPDRFDLVGAGLCLLGVAVMMYAPRG
jgi:small multidrug resistance family-3 protein